MIAAISALLVLVTMIIPTLPSLRQRRRTCPRRDGVLPADRSRLHVRGSRFDPASFDVPGPSGYGLAIGLFGIILSTGIGSLLSERISLMSGARITAWAGSLSIYLALLPFWFPAMIEAYEGGGLLLRAVASLAAIVPPGVLMGFGFPLGMRLVDAVDTRPTPRFWAANGAAGVLAASLSLRSASRSRSTRVFGLERSAICCSRRWASRSPLCRGAPRSTLWRGPLLPDISLASASRGK